MTADLRTLRVVIAGLGLAGGGMVAPALDAMPNASLAAASDVNPRALKRSG
jgi:predicted dehydrogenase